MGAGGGRWGALPLPGVTLMLTVTSPQGPRAKGPLGTQQQGHPLAALRRQTPDRTCPLQTMHLLKHI